MNHQHPLSLIFQITDRMIGSAIVKAADARDMHKFLKVGRDFATWIKDKIEKHRFVENRDYVVSRSVSSSPNPGSAKSRPQTAIEYHLTLRMAQHLGMLENNPQGDMVRDYFIALEEHALDLMRRHTAGAVFLLGVPTEWQKRFPDDFFLHAHRIYGITWERSGRCCLFLGGFINRYIYNHVWDGLSAELKKRRTEYIGDDDSTILKLHQFLNEHATEALNNHIQRVTGLLSASDNDRQFKACFDRMFENSKQSLMRLAA